MSSDSKISLQRILDLQDAISQDHIKKNRVAVDFLVKCIEFCLNRNMGVIPSNDCDLNNLAVFEHLYRETIASLVTAYRVALGGSVADAYAILRVVLEGLEFIGQMTDSDRYADVGKRIQSGEFRVRHFVDKRKRNKDADKVIGKLSDLAAHFTETRLAQGGYSIDGRPYVRHAYSYYESPNELGRRLGHFINVSLYAVRILRDYNDKYHIGCIPKSFTDGCEEIEADYQSLITSYAEAP